MIKKFITAKVLLGVGLAFVFAYAGISSLQQPLEWIAYVPHVLTHTVSATTAIRVIAVVELVLALWLLSGKYAKYAALVSAVMLIGIVVSNFGQMLITFRDVGLVFMALALFVSA